MSRNLMGICHATSHSILQYSHSSSVTSMMSPHSSIGHPHHPHHPHAAPVSLPDTDTDPRYVFSLRYAAEIFCLVSRNPQYSEDISKFMANFFKRIVKKRDQKLILGHNFINKIIENFYAQLQLCFYKIF